MAVAHPRRPKGLLQKPPRAESTAEPPVPAGAMRLKAGLRLVAAPMGCDSRMRPYPVLLLHLLDALGSPPVDLSLPLGSSGGLLLLGRLSLLLPPLEALPPLPRLLSLPPQLLQVAGLPQGPHSLLQLRPRRLSFQLHLAPSFLVPLSLQPPQGSAGGGQASHQPQRRHRQPPPSLGAGTGGHRRRSRSSERSPVTG